jgi:hypothetical protein
MLMIYSFDERVAKEVGVNAAIILDKFTWWIRQNAANERNFHDGRYWTYNSTKALTSMFPFFNAKQIGRILKKLIDDGYLLTGNYNKVAFDRTLWYTLSDKGERLMKDKEMHFPKVENEISQKWEMRFPENGKPIPVSTNNTPPFKTDSSVSADTPTAPPQKPKKKFVPPTLEEVTAYVAEKNLDVDPQKFLDYYETGDWHDGKGNKVKNWKQKCLTWDKHDNGRQVTTQPQQVSTQPKDVVDTDVDWSKFDG